MALGALVESISDHLAPIEATRGLLAQLHSMRPEQPALRLYYLSNMPVPFARGLEQRHAFLQWFDGGIFSGDVLHIKPDPAIYQLLQDRYALEPEQTVFIDDLQATIGLIFLIWTSVVGVPFTPNRIEHLTTMVIAAVLAHLPARWKNAPDAIRFRNTLFCIIASLALVFMGVVRLRGGWTW